MAELTAEQIALHDTAIGGSNCAVALGFSRRMSARHLYHVMRGEMPRPAVDEAMTSLGSLAEDMIITRFEGTHVMDDGGPCQLIRRRKTYRHRRHPWMIAHLDAVLRRVPEILETKLRGNAKDEDWGEDGTSSVPMDVELQCRHYLEVARKEVCWVMVLFLAQREFRCYRIERDPEMGRDIIKGLKTFMRCVEQGTPPAWDFAHDDTAEILARMFPGTDGSMIELPERLVSYHEVLQDVKEQKTNLDKLAQSARNVIKREMGNNAVGVLPDGSCYVRARRNRASGPVMALEWRRRVTEHLQR